MEISELEKEIEAIKNRNAKVELDKKWNYRQSKILDTTTPEGDKAQTEAYMASKQDYTENYKPGKIFNLKFKQCVYRTKDVKGGRVVGLGTTDFIKADYYKEHKMSEYDFDAFSHSASGSGLSNINVGNNNAQPTITTNDIFDEHSSVNPINTDSAGIAAFGASSVNDNSKVEDIFIDLDGDGVNDMSYADPFLDTKGVKGKKNQKNKQSD